MVTINDIARKADVSKSTVSKVINDYAGVNEKTKEKVFKIMKENNYWPNGVARTLSTNKSYMIGIFVPTHINHFFFREVINGIEKICGQNGYDLVYFTNNKWREDRDTGIEFSFVEKCKNRNVDGTMLVGFNKGNISRFNKLVESDIPSVFIDVDLVSKNTSYVMSDNIKGAKKAVKYLYDLGHRKLGMLMGANYVKPAHDRFLGFQQTINELGMEYNSDWVFSGKYTEENGYKAMKRILKMKEQPTAILGEDVFAIGAIRAIREEGLEVPVDFSVMGFDNIELSRHYNLTTINQKKFEMGKNASKLLLKIINGENFSPVFIPTNIVERDSCKNI